MQGYHIKGNGYDYMRDELIDLYEAEHNLPKHTVRGDDGDILDWFALEVVFPDIVDDKYDCP